ncbi:hypothetical protein SAMN06265795_11928 [Noviherbaspirillum humi]|uniref:Uncharacterized protein n=1 Tax=Noviherbaspirillum humi TaxID=1688639 RepID=A0A239L3C4_9BURK|nr:hypothetical protein SAMN06265795_11928 [Noviherbaspirillum humi]
MHSSAGWRPTIAAGYGDIDAGFVDEVQLSYRLAAYLPAVALACLMYRLAVLLTGT